MSRRGRSISQWAVDMIRGHTPLDRVHALTLLPMSVLERMRTDIITASRQERMERKRLRELSDASMRPLCPCPACASGHGVLTLFRWGLDPPRNEGYVVRCSNRDCIAMTLFPHATQEEATEMFSTGRLTDMPVEYHPELEPYGMEDILAEIAAGRGTDAETLASVYGLDPETTGKIMMLAEIRRVRHGDCLEASASLICPRCGATALPHRLQDGRRFIGWTYQCPNPGHERVCSVIARTKRQATEAFGRGEFQEADRS